MQSDGLDEAIDRAAAWLTASEPPAGLRMAVRARIELRRRRWGLMWLPAAATAVALLIAVIAFWPRAGERGESSDMAAGAAAGLQSGPRAERRAADGLATDPVAGPGDAAAGAATGLQTSSRPRRGETDRHSAEALDTGSRARVPASVARSGPAIAVVDPAYEAPPPALEPMVTPPLEESWLVVDTVTGFMELRTELLQTDELQVE